MFRRRTPKPVDLTATAYQRWLRALRPNDLPWFLQLSELDQESLARLGEEYLEDVITAVGYAIHNPEIAEAGTDAATNPKSEETLVRAIVDQFVQKLGAHPGVSPARPQPPAAASGRQQAPTTFGGIGGSRKGASSNGGVIT